MEVTKQALSQFLIDPVMNRDELVTINALWLQTQLRDYDKLKRAYTLLETSLERQRMRTDRLEHELELAVNPELNKTKDNLEISKLVGEVTYLKSLLDSKTTIKEINVHA